MTVTAVRDNGYPIIWKETRSAWEPEESEPCPRCGKARTPEGYDACIGHVPGAASVCCGHGLVPPYIQFDGEAALAAIEWAKRKL